MKQLSCAQCRAHWDDLISDNTIAADSPESAGVFAHLESCPECRMAFDLLVAARRELHALPAQKAPATLRAGIRSRIENQPKSVPWWQAGMESFTVSPQRVAWAGSALVAVFLVALLTRPQRQAEILRTTPQVLSNREQVQQHNQAHTQPPAAPVTASLKKRGRPHAATKTRSTPVTATEKNLPRHKAPTAQRSVLSHPLPQKSMAPTTLPKSQQGILAPPGNKPVPVPTPLAQKPARDETSPQAGQPAPPAEANRDGATNLQGSMGQAAPSFTANGSNSAAPMMRSMAAGSAVQARSFKANTASREIHWSKIFIAEQDAAHAQISIELEGGLAFADATEDSSLKRTLWEGSLHQGQQIPLSATLLHTSNQTGTLHLRMMDVNTQKVLLDEVITLSGEQ